MIKNSLNDYINLIRPTISTDIIDENNWQNISKVAQYLPSALTTFFGFESRLGTKKLIVIFFCVQMLQKQEKKY